MNVLRIFYFVEVGRPVMGGHCFLNFATVDFYLFLIPYVGLNLSYSYVCVYGLFFESRGSFYVYS